MKKGKKTKKLEFLYGSQAKAFHGKEFAKLITM